MKKQRNPTILLTGFANDLAAVVSRLDSTKIDVKLVNEEATADDVPEAADLVLYVLSRDTGYSSQLRGVFTYVQSRALSPQEYLLPIENIHPEYGVFPELSHLRQISISDLVGKLKHRGSAG
jgi:hypothetical protein